MTRAAEFHQAMIDGAAETTKFGYYPRYFVREVANQGGVATVKMLIGKRQMSDGFARLVHEHHLELSCEAFVIAPYYAELFEPHEVAWCAQQLRLVGFDVDGYLARVGENAP